MRLRPYMEKDFPYIRKWIDDERTHALWCANRLPFPLTEEILQNMLEESRREWGGFGYTFTEDSGIPVGFFLYNSNDQGNYGFVSYIIIDNSQRGRGYGTQMLRLLLKYAFTVANVSTVRLNVFDVNVRAKRCYEKAGFSVESFTQDALTFGLESWGRFTMSAVSDSESLSAPQK